MFVLFIWFCLFCSNFAAQDNLCRSLFQKKAYPTLETFSDRMCLYCVDRYITDGKAEIWKNYTVMQEWTINVTRFGAQYMDEDGKLYLMNYEEFRDNFKNGTMEKVLNELKSDFHRRALVKCCTDAHECCKQMLKQRPIDGHCPMEWDGDQCWPSALPNTLQEQTCPDNFFVSDSYLPPNCVRAQSKRKCLSGGRWEENYQEYYGTIISVTDQDQCSELNHPVRRESSRITVILQCYSLGMVIVSIVLLYSYKLKNQFTSNIHLNLYLSIVFSSITSICYEYFITRIDLDDPKKVDSTVCRIVNIAEKLFRLINFNWMLIEGFNFYHMVVMAQNYHRIKPYRLWFYGFGWLVPIPIMIVYTIIRSSLDDTDCWIAYIGKWEYLLVTLPYIAFALNCLFLLNIIYVIIQRFCLPQSSSSIMIAYGVKTSIILLPIFGVQYVVNLFPADTNTNCDLLIKYLHYLHIILDSAQGIIVSLALCLFNREVLRGIKRTFQQTFRKQSREISAYSTAYSTHTNITVGSSAKGF